MGNPCGYFYLASEIGEVERISGDLMSVKYILVKYNIVNYTLVNHN